MTNKTTIPSVAERLKAIEERLDLIERRFEPELTGLRNYDAQCAERQKDRAREREERAAAEPARARGFDEFTRERLLIEPGASSTLGHVSEAYRKWCDDHDVDMHVGRYTDEEVICRVLAFPAVEKKMILNHLGSRIRGVQGVGVRVEYRNERDCRQVLQEDAGKDVPFPMRYVG